MVLGRHSYGMDLRFSLDAGYMSFDGPQRARWDGYFIGSQLMFPQLLLMLSVTEDPPAATATPCPVAGQADPHRGG